LQVIRKLRVFSQINLNLLTCG